MKEKINNQVKDNGAGFCTHCGAIIPKDSVRCPECGKNKEVTKQNDSHVLISFMKVK